MDRFKPITKINKQCSKPISNEDRSSFSTKKTKNEEINKEIKQIFKDSTNSYEKIIELIKSKGTKVIQAKYMNKVLALIGENEGFISPLSGFKALYLSIMINILSPVKIPISFKTREIFVFQDKSYSTHYLIHQLYHWLSFLKGLPGYEYSSLHKLNNFFNNNLNFHDLNKLSTSEILALKETISRDREALKLVEEITRENLGLKDCLEKMKKGESFSL